MQAEVGNYVQTRQAQAAEVRRAEQQRAEANQERREEIHRSRMRHRFEALSKTDVVMERWVWQALGASRTVNDCEIGVAGELMVGLDGVAHEKQFDEDSSSG